MATATAHRHTKQPEPQPDRLPPSDLDAEQSTLGCMLLNAEAAQVALGMLTTGDFYREAHQTIFGAMVAVHKREQPIDLTTVTAQIKRVGRLTEVGGPEYILAIMQMPPSVEHVGHYAQIVLDCAHARRMLNIGAEIQARAYSGAQVQELLEWSDLQIGDLHTERARHDKRNPIPPHATAHELARYVGEQQWLWPGWLPQGHITLMASKRGVGKSALALHMETIVASGGAWPDGHNGDEPAYSLHLEAEGFQGGHASRLRQWGIPEAVQQRILFMGADGMDKLHLEQPDALERARAIVNAYDVRLIIIDALRQAHPYDENDSRVGVLLSDWQQLARDSRSALVVLHHMNKAYFGDSPPDLDDIRGSSAITDVCRSAIGLWTPDATRKRTVTAVQMKGSLLPADEAEDAGFAFEWDPLSGLDFNVGDLHPRDTTQKDRAREFIIEHLHSNQGHARRCDVAEAAEAAGLSVSSIDRAAREMKNRHITSRVVGGVPQWVLIDQRAGI